MTSGLWQKLIRPVLFSLGAERAHELGVEALKMGVGGSQIPQTYKEFGEISRFGLNFANPIGIAAGFDKNGVVVNQLASLGFGFVEVGTVTFEPQPGNPKPRLFRLPGDYALINRLGFNNDGAVAVAERLGKIDRKCIIGVNIGKNKDVPNEEATGNYLESFDTVFSVADYIAVNISSPNTPNLRELQQSVYLEELLAALQERNRDLSSKLSPHGGGEQLTRVGNQNVKPLLVKIAPDLGEADIEMIVDVCIRNNISGIIATNTTVSRDGLKTSNIGKLGDGGLSGKPLNARSSEVVSAVYRYANGKLPIIGVGGIFTAEDAFAKVAAGASLLQAYTGFVYRGPSFATEISRGLAAILNERGFSTIDDAVGSAID